MKEAIEKGELGQILATRAFLTWYRSDEYYKLDPWRGSWAQEEAGF